MIMTTILCLKHWKVDVIWSGQLTAFVCAICILYIKKLFYYTRKKITSTFSLHCIGTYGFWKDYQLSLMKLQNMVTQYESVCRKFLRLIETSGWIPNFVQSTRLLILSFSLPLEIDCRAEAGIIWIFCNIPNCLQYEQAKQLTKKKERYEVSDWS